MKMAKKIKLLNKLTHIGSKEATLTTLHNELVPIRNKINRLIKEINISIDNQK